MCSRFTRATSGTSRRATPQATCPLRVWPRGDGGPGGSDAGSVGSGDDGDRTLAQRRKRVIERTLLRGGRWGVFELSVCADASSKPAMPNASVLDPQEWWLQGGSGASGSTRAVASGCLPVATGSSGHARYRPMSVPALGSAATNRAALSAGTQGRVLFARLLCRGRDQLVACTRISTRRFCWRPALVALLARGSLSPRPMAFN